MSDFVHLHLHSEYSLLDGACRIEDIPAMAKANGHSAVAITDHGALYGAVAFWRACTACAVKPIIGCEVYVAGRSRFLKEGKMDASGHHLVLLAENETGYRNLIKLVSLSFTEGFYSKPRVDKELLRKYHGGLIALSACLSGEIPSLILSGGVTEAENAAKEYAAIFGPEHFYLELQNHGIADEARVATAIRAISERTGIPTVATNDVHYLRKRDASVQTTLMCIQTNNVVGEDNGIGFETDEFYYKSTEEMQKLFPHDAKALENTVKIAQRCCFDFTFGHFHLPTFPQSVGRTHREMLCEKTYKGFQKRIDSGAITFSEAYPKSAYEQRLAYELSVIDSMGFNEYYLIVEDFVGYAKSHGIPVGPGRGSGAGSLVAFCVGITDVDSLRYDLLFERFLNPERISLPDFDIDFCYEKRDSVIRYVREKYGQDRVAQIITFGTLQAKAAVRDTARALGIPYADGDRVAKLIPTHGTTIREALHIKELKEIYESSPKLAQMLDTAMALEGMPRHISTHAAGVVITEKPLMEYVPLSVSSGVPVVAYDMNTVADLGLVKFDFLGLRYLTVLSRAEENVRATCPDFSLEKVPFDDKKTYELLSNADTDGVFQLESQGIKAVLTQLKPTRLEDIIACIALYRPGPMESIGTFIARKNGTEPIVYAADALKPILENTYGCIVYQEQVMQIFRSLGGYSYAKADLVRRAMSKKKASEMDAEYDSFVSGAGQRGIESRVAGDIFKEMAAFANYAFNKSHATAYAFISYRTAYMKANHPAAYTAALLSAQQATDITRASVKILPPHINESQCDFSVAGEAVRYGFLQLKNVGQNFADAIVSCRKLCPFSDFADFAERMAAYDLNRRQVEALIKCGAFDCFGVTRSSLLAVYESIIEDALAKKRSNVTGQIDMFGSSSEAEDAKTKIDYPHIPEYPLRDLLRMEKEIAGVCFSGHLLEGYRKHLHSLHVDSLYGISQNEDNRFCDRAPVRVGGIVARKTVKKTRSGEAMAFVTLEDFGGEAEVIVFPKQYEACLSLFEQDNAILVEGHVSLKEDEAPKIIFSKGEHLRTNGEFAESAPPKKAEKGPAKLYLKVPSMNSVKTTQTLTLLQDRKGSVEVILYDSEKKKYVKANGYATTITDKLLVTLKELLGESNVRYQ